MHAVTGLFLMTCLRESKTVLDSGFQILGTEFQILGQWNLDSRHFQSLIGFCPYSLSCNVDCLLPATMFFYYNYYLEPICAVGHGVAGLCSARREDRKSWSFKSYSLTGVTF